MIIIIIIIVGISIVIGIISMVVTVSVMIRIHSAKERRAAVLSRAIYCVMLHIVLIRCQRRLHVVSPRAFRLLKV